MTNDIKQEIAKVIIKVLKSRFNSFPDNELHLRNAPFHKAFLQAFAEKFDSAGTNIDVMISMSSWMHGLNTSLGQTFFENTAHILCSGVKRSFSGSEFIIYSEQNRVIDEIMTSLKNGEQQPNKDYEDNLLNGNSYGDLVDGTNFTVDCYIEDNDSIIAIELKSVRPNSGETKGEKTKILKAKAMLRNYYPNKQIHYYFGFPFDPTSNVDVEYNKRRFMSNMIEFPKFCDENEILLSDELWSFLSGEENTMNTLLELIRDIATPHFAEKYNFISDVNNLISQPNEYISILEEWKLIDELRVAENITRVIENPNRSIRRAFYSCPFNDKGEYNDGRIRILLNAINY